MAGNTYELAGQMLGATELDGDRKIEVDISWLDFGYIESCSDPDKLFAILDVLKSGSQGRYPALEEAADKQLLKVLPPPRRSIYLAKTRGPTFEDRQQAADGIAQWLRNTKEASSSLPTVPRASGTAAARLPPPRGHAPPASSSQEHAASVASAAAARRKSPQDPKSLPFSEAYSKWTDAEVQEQMKRLEAQEQGEGEGGGPAAGDREDMGAAKARRRHLQALGLGAAMDPALLSDRERRSAAENERSKGNDAFRAGEFEQAARFYGRALALLGFGPGMGDLAALAARPAGTEGAGSTIRSGAGACASDVRRLAAVVSSNRAQANIELKRYAAAEADATAAVSVLEQLGAADVKSLVKALLRRAKSRLSRGKSWGAVSDCRWGLELDEGNAAIKGTLRKAETQLRKQRGREVADKILAGDLPPPETEAAGMTSESKEVEGGRGSARKEGGGGGPVQLAIEEESDTDGGEDDEGSSSSGPVQLAIEEESDSDSESESDSEQAGARAGFEASQARDKAVDDPKALASKRRATSESLKAQGVAHWAAGDTPTAISLLRKAVAADPTFLPARANLSNALLGAGEHRAALHHAWEAARLTRWKGLIGEDGKHRGGAEGGGVLAGDASSLHPQGLPLTSDPGKPVRPLLIKCLHRMGAASLSLDRPEAAMVLLELATKLDPTQKKTEAAYERALLQVSSGVEDKPLPPLDPKERIATHPVASKPPVAAAKASKTASPPPLPQPVPAPSAAASSSSPSSSKSELAPVPRTSPRSAAASDAGVAASKTAEAVALAARAVASAELPPPPTSSSELERAVELLLRRVEGSSAPSPAAGGGSPSYEPLGRYLLSVEPAKLKTLVKRKELGLGTVEGLLRGAAAVAAKKPKATARAVAALCASPGVKIAAGLLSAEDTEHARSVLGAATAADVVPKARAKIASTFRL